MTVHKPVLLKETIELLNIKKGMTVVDATLGGGGHSEAILKEIGNEGKLIAIDLDIQAIEKFAEILNDKIQISNQFQSLNSKIKKFDNVYLANGNFADLENILSEIEVEKVDAILADLGWSSDQVENPEYGMSFMKEAELDMRLNQSQELTAKKIVNEYSQKELEKIIREYGEEKLWKGIARKIIEYRKDKNIETTIELAEIIRNATPQKFQHGKIHPATRTFQALRIETNRELESLEKFIPVAIEKLSSKGRLAIITFHSLEDRIVKNIFRENARGCICPADFPQCVCGKVPKINLINKKPINPTPGEVVGNPRARSAKLRVCEKN
jgi:16S rRNA (cytosine1402-N4)-methyltransferase